ncbi:YqkE family protein [Sporosarcina sp. ACRSL]|uniref:YqkE family protein n=1 Tax=Sporosarcina sp. ACRSL TaxID=2918215 RepID=UPI001EF57E6E|nr:YqkE family protein [Sporosarcina sp. ACRSL]MCG7342966.1 YqkE family protein [Sporosarcina sp. ACRSL]
MAKKKSKTIVAVKQENEKMTLSDALDSDVLLKLKDAKKEMTAKIEAEEAERQEQLRRERKEREKNKSFAELLEEYGDSGSKY